MPIPASSNPKSTGAPSDPSGSGAAPIAPDFQESLRQFWAKNGNSIYLGVAFILLVIVGKGGYDWYQQQREESMKTEYATAGATTEKLKSFALAHPDHALAGVAWLRLADEAYSGKKYSEAVADYQKAADVLKSGPLGGRAQLGLAVSSLYSGQPIQAEEKFKQLASDVNQLKPIRAEAAYDLASLAAAANKIEETTKYLDLVGSIEPNGVWAQRAFSLRATLPPTANSATISGVSANPAVSIALPPKP